MADKEKPKLTIPQLISKLEGIEDQTEKRKIRARLRAMGHKGGAGRRKTGAKKVKASVKKGKRAKKEAPAS